jgi:DNA-binding MarR family transcriptional regulator
LDIYTKRQITREIVAIARCLSYIREVDFKSLNLKRNQHIFLVRVMENPGVNQEDLSQSLRIDKTTTAKALKKLEEKGYIKRVKSKDDRRSFCLWPTKKTRDIYPQLIESIIRTAEQGVANFSDVEIKQLLNLLQKFRKEIVIQWDIAKNRVK